MLLYDPEGATYEIDGSRMDLAAEYRARPRGPFSPDLQKVLDRMRTTPLAGRYALIVVTPFKEFALCRLSGVRGVPPEPVPGVRYTSMAEAEWDIFKRRWADLTGQAVSLGEDDDG